MQRYTKLHLALAAALLTACTTVDAPPPPNTLVVARVSAPPTLDGSANDATWSAARPLTVRLTGGANFGGSGETTATLKAVTSGDMIYFLIQYADPTNQDAVDRFRSNRMDRGES